MKEIADVLKMLIQELHLPPMLIAAGFASATVALLYWHWVKHRHLFDGQRIRVARVKDYLSDSSIDCPTLRKILSEERDDQVFAHVFGYRLDSARRKILHPIVEAAGSPITWSNLKAARSYIEIEKGNMVVNVGTIDRVMHTIQKAYVLLLIVATVLSAGLLLIEVSMRGKDALSMLISVCFLCLILFLMTLPDNGVRTALNLVRWLESQKGKHE